MKMPPSRMLICALSSALLLAAGCSPTKPIYLHETGDLSYYLDQATAVEYPDADIPSLDEVTQAQAPLTVIDSDFTSFEDVTLEDVVSMALLNTKVVRGYGTPGLQSTRVAPGQDSLANNPNAASTTYNIAIRESEPGVIAQPGAIANPSSVLTNTQLDANQGVEAALADFDAQLTSSFTVAKNNEPRNIGNPNNPLTFVDPFRQTQVTWQSEIAKKSANGTQLFFRNINQYIDNNGNQTFSGNQFGQAHGTWYRTSLEAEIRQPLLRGRGAFINRMPIVISRISTDQEIANLESTLQNMVTNIEIRYWDLYLAYRTFEASKTGRDAALVTWRIIKDQFNEGTEVTIQNLAQAAEQYHNFDAQVIDAYNNLLNAEGQLRYLLGWSSTDGRFLRPIDEPVMAPVEFDWHTTLAEALTYRPEVRQERWEIKKRELALQYAKNGLLPELNLSFVYRWLGLGDKYGTSGDNAGFPGLNSGAWNELYGGDYQELSVGGTFAMPVGFRREEANVRNAQLKLAREIARAEDMELDISREMSETLRALAANQLIMRSSFNRWINTTEEVEHFKRLQDAGVENLDVALDAQRRRSQSEIAFYSALIEYNKCIALVHRRKGTVLEYSGIDFSEGPWPGKAYVDASEHARRRSASRQVNYGWTRPQVISRGSEMALAGQSGMLESIEGTPTLAEPHTVGSDLPIYEESQPLDMQLEELPYYIEEVEISPAAGQPLPDLQGPGTPYSQATPANTAVQLASHEEPVAEAGAPVLRATPTDGVAPVAIRKPGTEVRPAALPRRDQPPQASRLPGAEDSAANSDLPRPTATAISWERMGLTRPEKQDGATTARITSLPK